MKRILTVIALLVWSVTALAQESQLPQVLEIAEVDTESAYTAFQIVDVPVGSQHHYFFDVGTLGFGDELIQVNIDPLFHLFIPLGDTLAEAKDMLQQLQELAKSKPGSCIELSGTLSPGYPGDVYEPVMVTARKVLLSRSLEFSIQREGYIRAAYVSRMDLNSLVGSVKFYSKIHPKEK